MIECGKNKCAHQEKSQSDEVLRSFKACGHVKIDKDFGTNMKLCKEKTQNKKIINNLIHCANNKCKNEKNDAKKLISEFDNFIDKMDDVSDTDKHRTKQLALIGINKYM